MNNILKEFWYGNISPHEHFYPDTKEMQNLSELIERDREEIAAALSEEKRPLLDRYDDNILELDDLSNEELFEYAFSLGVRLSAECFIKDRHW